ncbi:hypothetical protein BJX70DRAFT_406419 [Aspergillus crustosus]
MIALPPPNLTIPVSSSTVTVRIIDSTTTLLINPPLFWTPAIPSITPYRAPALCFLISNEIQNRHVLFDLGVRKDWENSAPRTVQLIKGTTEVTVEKGIAEILDEQGDQYESGERAVRSTDIEAIIWSHHHFDHTGDPSTFAHSTSLVVGPGVKEHIWPGYPTDPSSSVLDSDIAGRSVTELDFSKERPDTCKIGRFNAVDYFHDGSFYILDAPGHCVGHVCALARVTSCSASASDSGDRERESFIFMGGDSAHHVGLLRPSPYIPIPKAISPSPFRSPSVNPTREVIQSMHPEESITDPFLKPARGMFPDYEAAEDTINKIQEMDAAENVLVVLPHDRTLLGEIELFPGKINGWLEEGVKERVRWAFLGDFEGAL